MALTWSLTDIEDYKTVCYTPVIPALGEGELPPKEEYTLNPITESLIFLSMAVGMPQITDKNFRQFHARVAVWESGGAMLRDDKGAGRPIVMADVKQHIGLRTNASKKTSAQFKKSVMNALWDKQATYEIRSAI